MVSIVRLAKLSEGQLVDGKLECLYHGWQFDGQGKCVKIPQVSSHLSCTFNPTAPMEHV
jgi:phenylpropionate dioxygenase-like ring-hydroxylating dioxygenase large terminal subunit